MVTRLIIRDCMTHFDQKSRKNIQSRLIFFFCLFRLIIAAPSDAAAETPLSGQTIVSPGTPWHLVADRITYDQNTRVYTAFGDVQISNADNTLSADTITYNHDTMQAESTGNVRLISGKDTLRGDRIIINLDTGIGTIENGVIFVEKSHFYIRGNRILKTGENSYSVDNAQITSCDGEVPDWRITGKKVDFTIESFGTVQHATLWAKKLPVLYVPFLVFPVNINRQTGLLPPQGGYSSRNGIEYIQPFFWAIGQSSDATFYYHHLQNRGEKFGGEYRYALSDFSKGSFMADSLDDRKIDDGTGDTSDRWGYSKDLFLRENSDRYWFRAKLNQKLPLDMTAKLDLDVVSDQDYLREFSSGYTGYDDTKKYFESEFGRDIDDENDPVRENHLNVNKIWRKYSFNGDLRWYDNVIKRRQSDTDDTLQQLPAITFDALKQSVFTNRVFMGMNSGYAHFYRRDGLTGQRLDLHPRVYLPMHFKHYFTFEPSAGVRQTFWYLDRPEDDTPDLDEYDYQHRELYDLAAELSTDLSRVFPMPGDTSGKIKHTLTPRLEYSYVPDVSQEEYPDFDDTDRIMAENRLTFSITNYLISKTLNRPAASELSQAVSDELSDEYSTHAFLWFKIEQVYDFIKKNEPDEKPFCPLTAELSLTPANRLSLRAETEWDHDKGHFTLFNTYCRIRSGTGDYLMVDYRHIRGTSQSVNLAFQTAVTRSIGLFGNYERNIETSEDIEKKIGTRYNAQCWALDCFFKEDDDDRNIGFMITLKGLGEFGSEL